MIANRNHTITPKPRDPLARFLISITTIIPIRATHSQQLAIWLGQNNNPEPNEQFCGEAHCANRTIRSRFQCFICVPSKSILKLDIGAVEPYCLAFGMYRLHISFFLSLDSRRSLALANSSKQKKNSTQ